MILFQITMGIILTGLIALLAPQFASTFVPEGARETSLNYVRISSLTALSSAMEVSVSSCTRSLDKPNVPLVISTVKFVVNIILDVLFISKFHVFSMKPTVNGQALIQMTCDFVSSLCGLLYFLYIAYKLQYNLNKEENEREKSRPNWNCLKILARPSFYTFVESVIRNAIYLWLVSNIVSMVPILCAYLIKKYKFRALITQLLGVF